MAFFAVATGLRLIGLVPSAAGQESRLVFSNLASQMDQCNTQLMGIRPEHPRVLHVCDI